MNIKEVLTTLDPQKDDLWTTDGYPLMQVMRDRMNDDTLTRVQVTDADPEFTREKAIRMADGSEPDKSAEEVSDGEASTETETETAPTEEVNRADEIDLSGLANAGEPQPTEPDMGMDTSQDDEEDLPAQLIVDEPAPLPTELEMLQADLAERTLEMQEALRTRDKAKARSDELADEVNALNVLIASATPLDSGKNMSGIKAYLKSQNELRLRRAGRLRRFLDLTDADPKEVRKAMDIRVPLDAAMMGRKPARGTVRPAVRMP